MSTELEQTETTELGRWRAFRAAITERPTLNLAYRIVVGVVGLAVLILGIIAIPYPGPGWLIVFAGLGILATEFTWAHQALGWLRHRYDKFMEWFAGRGLVVQACAALFTFLFVVATLWLLGTFGMVGGWIGVESKWLHSPLTW
ncbi:TIGR02611 family protein [Nocardia sp. NPDC050712]|uniref:TIGR02611 family protein n=1 Tax=Nocardia sp. NPDC050712 TaxID=3155518 RepID=UPI0033F4F763